MNHFLCISNKGEIDIAGFRIMGASTKRGDEDAIGFFGTGNKYALAYFLRNNVGIRIFSGEHEVVIDARPITFGDKQFKEIYIDGNATSLVTEMGPTWRLWQAVREVYSNAVDAGMLECASSQNLEGKAGETRYYIPITDELWDMMQNWSDYFCNLTDPVLVSSSGVRIFDIEGDKDSVVYRRGIRCIQEEQLRPMAYSADFKNLEINEERIATSNSQIAEGYFHAIFNSDCEEAIRKVVFAIKAEGTMEHYFAYGGILPGATSETFKSVICSIPFTCPSYDDVVSKEEAPLFHRVSDDFVNWIIRRVGKGELKLPKRILNPPELYEVLQPTEMQANILKMAKTAIASSGIDVPYPIEIVRFSEKNVVGHAEDIGGSNPRILIGETVLPQSIGSVVDVIMEEYIHIKYETFDCTRPMQDALTKELTGVIMRSAGINTQL